jgi:hypothetical protein
MNPATSPGDLHVPDTGGAKLLLLIPRSAENRVGVRVHESRRNNGTRAIDALSVRISALELVLWPYGSNRVAIESDSGTGKNPGIAHLLSTACTSGTSAGHDLRRVYKESLRQA